MSKEKLARMKGFFSALLVLTLASILLVPTISEIINNGSVLEINIFMTFLLAWILFAVTLGIIYFAKRRKELEPIPVYNKGVR